MKQVMSLGLGVVLLAGLTACDRGGGAAGSAVAVETAAATVPLTVGDKVIRVELADTPEKSQRGLMNRRSMPEDHGMLFVFPQPRRASFWMHNTLIPLSIGFFDRNGVLLEVREMQALDETTTFSRSREVVYALEMNQGWFDRHGIKPGVRVQMPAATFTAP